MASIIFVCALIVTINLISKDTGCCASLHQDKGNLSCSETINGSLDAGVSHYYTFQLQNHSSVTFDSCGSIDTALRLLGTYYIYNQDEDQCGLRSRISVTTLPPYEYKLMIYSFDDDDGEYEITVECGLNITDKSKYVWPATTPFDWFDAARECELLFGTTMCTIQTDEDFEDAMDTFMLYGADIVDAQQRWWNLERVNTTLWIGLYSDMNNNGAWTWMSPSRYV